MAIKDKEARLAYGRQYAKANRERAAEWLRRYREENREAINEKRRLRYAANREANREAINEKRRLRCAANRERRLERERRYREENREAINEKARLARVARNEANREKIAEKRRQSIERRIQKQKANNKINYAASPEKYKDKATRWQKNNPERTREINHRHYCKKKCGEIAIARLFLMPDETAEKFSQAISNAKQEATT